MSDVEDTEALAAAWWRESSQQDRVDGEWSEGQRAAYMGAVRVLVATPEFATYIRARGGHAVPEPTL